MARQRFRFTFAPLPSPTAHLFTVQPLSGAVTQMEALRPVEPRLTPRDEAVYLLHAAAEVEHALMVQYLYAAYSLDPTSPSLTPDQKTAVGLWQQEIVQIAREEMGHLACVQNLLRLLGGAGSFEREEFPF